MNTVKQMFKSNIRQYGMLIALLSIMMLFQILSKGVLMLPLNITNLILQNSYILVLAIGMILVIITGNIDLSVGSVAAFVGAVSAIMMVNMKVPFLLALPLALILGGVIGAFQGFLIAYVRIPAFIATLGGMLIFRGLTMVTLKGMSVGPFPVAFQKIASGFSPDLLGNGKPHITTLVLAGILSIVLIIMDIGKRKKQRDYGFEVLPIPLMITKLVLMIGVLMYFFWIISNYKGIPNVLFLLFGLIMIYSFVSNRTVVGRHIYALGGNEKAAKLSGVKTRSVTFWVYVNMGVLAALSGLVFAARLNSATPKAGVNFELDAIAACFIGGASASGGIGTVIGAMIGGLVMGVMNNGMSLVGIGIDWQQAIKGCVLLLAVAFDVYTKSKSN